MEGRKNGFGRGLMAAAAVALALATGLLASPRASAESPTISVDSVTVAPGEQRSVNLKALDIASPGLGAWMIDIMYDPAVVTPVTCSATQGTSACNVDFASDTVRVVGASASGLMGDTTLASITFECNGAGSSALTPAVWELADATTGGPLPISHAVQAGNIACVPVVPPHLGDANCDGTVNAVDAAYVLQFVGGLISSVPCPGNADVDRNGHIDSIDAALILQIVAGLWSPGA